MGNAELKSIMSDGYDAYVFIGNELKSVLSKDTVHQVCMSHAYDNEPIPVLGENGFLNGSIRPIGLQAFKRPGAQQGYGLHLSKKESLKAYMYRFTFTCEESETYYRKFADGDGLWIKDELVDKAKAIAKQEVFSFDVFNEAFYDYRSKGFSGNKLKKYLPNDIKLKTKVEDVVFTAEERTQIIELWNNKLGKAMASTIFRKRWFEHEGVEDSNDGQQRIVGIHNEHAFRSLKQLETQQMLLMIACPDGPEGAEWKNYTNTPCTKKKMKAADNAQWTKVPARMEDMFGSPYLTKKDWRI